MQKNAPWDQIEVGDAVYFKDSGEPVTLRSKVRNVLQFENLTPEKVGEIIKKYGREDGLDVGEFERWFGMFKDKKYCLLIFLGEVESIEPFEIEKKGFGTMSAWITVKDVSTLRKVKFTQCKLIKGR